MREIRSSGSLRGGVGNAPAYSAEGFGCGTACRRVEAGEAAVGVGLQDPGLVSQMGFRMLATVVAGIVEEHCRWPRSAPGRTAGRRGHTEMDGPRSLHVTQGPSEGGER